MSHEKNTLLESRLAQTPYICIEVSLTDDKRRSWWAAGVLRHNRCCVRDRVLMGQPSGALHTPAVHTNTFGNTQLCINMNKPMKISLCSPPCLQRHAWESKPREFNGVTAPPCGQSRCHTAGFESLQLRMRLDCFTFISPNSVRSSSTLCWFLFFFLWNQGLTVCTSHCVCLSSFVFPHIFSSVCPFLHVKTFNMKKMPLALKKDPAQIKECSYLDSSTHCFYFLFINMPI